MFKEIIKLTCQFIKKIKSDTEENHVEKSLYN